MSFMDRAADILGIISARKAAGEPFALATVVRTVAATAAKAGAKAVILSDGTISEGWIGGSQGRSRGWEIASRFGAAF
jgi:xanthine dehydrogenase accessory factor